MNGQRVENARRIPVLMTPTTRWKSLCRLQVTQLRCTGVGTLVRWRIGCWGVSTDVQARSCMFDFVAQERTLETRISYIPTFLGS
mmetsp:Transcript_46038/g.105463  ORF Transcript_46038/g.105463 Transcript_46038/m.105463 type:complete len:85 (+) Transcript_46038:1106-1360(+)